MKNNSKQSLLPVYLDLEKSEKLSEDLIQSIFVSRIDQNKKEISKRFKEITELGMSYDTPSVRLYHEARDLFILGYFKSTIMICRATAEYLAYELGIEFIELDGSGQTIETIVDKLDFRKIVNDFLFREINPLIKSGVKTKKLFNDLYDLGNNWVHPKSKRENLDIQVEAKSALLMLRELIDSERNVLKDNEIYKGVLRKKKDSRVYKRGIKLGEGQ